MVLITNQKWCMPTTISVSTATWQITCGTPPVLRYGHRPSAASAGSGENFGIGVNGRSRINIKSASEGVPRYLYRIGRIARMMLRLRRWLMRSGTAALRTRGLSTRYTNKLYIFTVSPFKHECTLSAFLGRLVSCTPSGNTPTPSITLFISTQPWLMILENCNLQTAADKKMYRSPMTGEFYDCVGWIGCINAAILASFPPELLWVARSPFMQCLTIQGCFCTSTRGIRFSGSKTSNFRRSASEFHVAKR